MTISITGTEITFDNGSTRTSAGWARRAIFAYGYYLASRNEVILVSETGIPGVDLSGVGTARVYLAAASFGRERAIFGYGRNDSVVYQTATNIVDFRGTQASDVTGIGTARSELAAATYGVDKAIFGYGFNGNNQSLTNLVSNIGVVATDTTGVGTARTQITASSYGDDKAIFGYGFSCGGCLLLI